MSQIKYRFSINGQAVNPHWADTLLKEYNLQTDQRFFRAGLSGRMDFIRDDYDYIAAQPFDTEFVLLIEQYINGAWVSYLEAKFNKTNVNWDADDKRAAVSFDVKDQYTDVLKGWEKEYNLIKLTPGKVELEIQKRPLLQIYVPGDELISAFLSGITWEQDLNFSVTDVNDLVNVYKFAASGNFYGFEVFGNGTPADVKGIYSAKGTDDLIKGAYKITYFSGGTYIIDAAGHGKAAADVGSLWQQGASVWKLISIENTNQLKMARYSGAGAPTGPPGSMTHLKNAVNTATINYTAVGLPVFTDQYEIRRISDNAIMFYSRENYPSTRVDRKDIEFFADNGTGVMTGDETSAIFYMRYLLDVDFFNGSATFDIPDEDLVAYNRQYRKVAPYDGSAMLVITSNTQTDPTEYGLAPDGTYYTIPSGGASKYFPAARSRWSLQSTWIDFDQFDKPLEVSGRKPFILKDATPIEEAIKAFLAEIAPVVLHDNTAEYSQFLYAPSNPLGGPQFRLMITQKTNLLVGQYDQPAQKAPLTFSELMGMLRAYDLYWYIDSTDKLKIEHVSWFKNGGSYSPNPQYNADLTTLIQPVNKKPWGFRTNKFSYDKANLPERIQFNWMDAVTLAFGGYPIEILSNFVQEGRVEDFNAGEFTSDVDFMLLAPEKISNEGFALFAAVRDDANLFDKDDPDNDLGNYIDPDTGALIANASYNTSDFIGVIGTQYYTFSYNYTLAWYDDTQTYISGVAFSRDSSLTQQAPEGAYYLRISVLTTNWNGLQVIRGKDLNGLWTLPFVSQTVEGANVELQNGYATWLYMHPNFWIYDLPSSNVDINDGQAVTVQGVKRNKKQTVNYPSLTDPDPLKLIKTYLGDGEIEKLSVNLSSRNITADLRYDTE